MSTFHSKLAQKVTTAIFLSGKAVHSWYAVFVHLLKPAMRKWWSWQRTLTLRGLTFQSVLFFLLIVLRTFGPRLRRYAISWQRAIHRKYHNFILQVKKVRRVAGRCIFVALPHLGFALVWILIVNNFPAWADRLADYANMQKLAIAAQSVVSIYTIHLAENHTVGIDGRSISDADSTTGIPVSSSGASATGKTLYLFEPRLRSSLINWIALAMAITCHRLARHALSWIPFGASMAAGVGVAKKMGLAYSLLLLWLQLPIDGSQLVCTYLMPYVLKYFPSAQASTNGGGGNGRLFANTFTRLLSVLVWSNALSPAHAQTLTHVRT